MKQKLPKYTYVPGLTRHPVSDPAGHWHGVTRSAMTVPESISQGVELFDRGYYWEAHEVWEAGWVQLGRRGPRADFLKGLIKLAACGVKCLEQNADGAVRHARRAAELLAQNREGIRDWTELAELVDVEQALSLAEQLKASPPIADEHQRQQAQQGGVPLWEPIGQVP